MKIASFQRPAELARFVQAMRRNGIARFDFTLEEVEDEYRPIGPRRLPRVGPPDVVDGPAQAGQQKILWRVGTARARSSLTLAMVARIIAADISRTCLKQWTRSPAYLQRIQDVAKRNRIELAEYPRALYARTSTHLRLHVDGNQLAVTMTIDTRYGACRLRAFDCSNDWPIEIA